jgi:hypothetical protein
LWAGLAGVILAIGAAPLEAMPGRGHAAGSGFGAPFRFVQAEGDPGWKALEAEQERRRREREAKAARSSVVPKPAAVPKPVAVPKPSVAPRQAKRVVPEVRRRAVRPVEPAPRAVRRARAAPAPSRAPARATEAARAEGPGSKVTACYRAVGIQVDASGRPLRDIAGDDRSNDAFIRCIDGRL